MSTGRFAVAQRGLTTWRTSWRDIGFSERSSLRPGIDLHSQDSGAFVSFAASLFLEVDVRVPPAHPVPVISDLHRDHRADPGEGVNEDAKQSAIARM